MLFESVKAASVAMMPLSLSGEGEVVRAGDSGDRVVEAVAFEATDSQLKNLRADIDRIDALIIRLALQRQCRAADVEQLGMTLRAARTDLARGTEVLARYTSAFDGAGARIAQALISAGNGFT